MPPVCWEHAGGFFACQGEESRRRFTLMNADKNLHHGGAETRRKGKVWLFNVARKQTENKITGAELSKTSATAPVEF